jgi:hypothetical protein
VALHSFKAPPSDVVQDGSATVRRRSRIVVTEFVTARHGGNFHTINLDRRRTGQRAPLDTTENGWQLHDIRHSGSIRQRIDGNAVSLSRGQYQFWLKTDDFNPRNRRLGLRRGNRSPTAWEARNNLQIRFSTAAPLTIVVPQNFVCVIFSNRIILRQ